MNKQKQLNNMMNDIIKEMEKTKSHDEWLCLKEKYESYDRFRKSERIINPEKLLDVATNIVGIVLILRFEQFDIIRSKAFNMIWKGR